MLYFNIFSIETTFFDELEVRKFDYMGRHNLDLSYADNHDRSSCFPRFILRCHKMIQTYMRCNYDQFVAYNWCN